MKHMIRMCTTIPEVFDHLANQHLRGSEGLEKVLNFQDCILRKPSELASLTKIDEIPQKWEIIQRINIAQYATEEIIQGLVEHLFLFQQQEEWYQKLARSQALRTRNSKKFSLIEDRNQSMMADPNYSVLN